jgi:proteic killer suppression protein
MDITFSKNKIKKYANNDTFRKKNLGAISAKRFTQRLEDLEATENLEECRNLPGKYHELVGNRKGQWACNLEHPYRLIFTPHENPIPENKDGQYLWIKIEGIELLEVEDYH